MVALDTSVACYTRTTLSMAPREAALVAPNITTSVQQHATTLDSGPMHVTDITLRVSLTNRLLSYHRRDWTRSHIHHALSAASQLADAPRMAPRLAGPLSSTYAANGATIR